MSNPQTVEYYLVRDGGFMKFEWEGPDPSFVVVATLEGALREMGVFELDPTDLWPAAVGTPWFVVPATATADLAEVFAETPWVDFLTPGRIRDTLGVSDEHAAAPSSSLSWSPPASPSSCARPAHTAPTCSASCTDI